MDRAIGLTGWEASLAMKTGGVDKTMEPTEEGGGGGAVDAGVAATIRCEGTSPSEEERRTLSFFRGSRRTSFEAGVLGTDSAGTPKRGGEET